MADKRAKTQRSTGASCLTGYDVASRLIQSGLRTSFDGKIKCYNCHSAEGTSGFAQSLADTMFAKGFVRCTFWGYSGQLSSAYGDDRHKSSSEGPARPSERRLQVFPKGALSMASAL
jgi:hypothetical protein